jgi:hypothetical protein
MNLNPNKTESAYVPSASDYQAQAHPAIRSDDLLRAKEKGLATDDAYTDEYMMLQSQYRAALDEYLVAKLNLTALNEHLATSPLGFETLEDTDVSIAQRTSTMGLTHVYLANNLYIERLDESDLAILQRRLTADENAVSDEMNNLVERTYCDVIRILYPNDESSRDYDVIYPDGTGALSGSLILAVSNPTKFDKDGALADDNWQERQNYLEGYLANVRDKMEKELGNPITIFLMDYSTVSGVIE